MLLGWSCPTLKFSLPGQPAFYKCICLYEKNCMAVSCTWGRLPGRPVALNFTLLFFSVCILGWKAFKPDRSFAHFLQVELRGKASDGTAHTQLSRAVLKTKIHRNPCTSQTWSNADIAACGAASFSAGCLYRLITVRSLVKKQLPDVRHECSALTHCQVCHAQDNHVQEIQESGFIFQLIFCLTLLKCNNSMLLLFQFLLFPELQTEWPGSK